MTLSPGETETEVNFGNNSDNAAPTVAGVQVGNDAAQPWVVNGMAITFSELVNIDTGAFEVIHRETGTAVDVSFTTEDIDGRTTATLTFGGTHTEYGSLVDGNYQLTIREDRVCDRLSGLNLDGDEDGESGGDYLFGDEAVDNFFCFFGDTDGDRDVDGSDFGRFGLTFRKRVGQEGYNPSLDYDCDGDVDGQDYGQFALRFRKRLYFE